MCDWSRSGPATLDHPMTSPNKDPTPDALPDGVQPVDPWTRVFPPPKARISGQFAAPGALWRRTPLVLAVLACGVLLLSMAFYARQRTPSVRDAEIARGNAEPTRSELREQSGAAARAEFDRKRAEAQAELARRRAAAEAERQRAKGSSENDRSGAGRP